MDDAGSLGPCAARIVRVAVGDLPVERVDAARVRRARSLAMWIRTPRSRYHGRPVWGIVTESLDPGKAVVELGWAKHLDLSEIDMCQLEGKRC